MVNGVPSSVHDLDDPGLLDFDYLRWIALTLLSRPAVDPTARTDVLHLGAGGCSLARHLADALPGSRHLAVEIDAALAEGVRRWFPLPTAPVLRIRVGDARTVTESLGDGSRDVVVRDVFAGAVTPAALTTVEFTREVQRVLRPGGLYLANSIGVLGEIHGELGTLAAVFPYIAVIAHASTLKDRQRGNLILAGSDTPFVTPAVRTALLRDRTPAQLRGRDELGAAVDVRRALRDAAHGGWSAP
nr:fused MFS/spermidine synthase [Nakamurella flavida]